MSPSRPGALGFCPVLDEEYKEHRTGGAGRESGVKFLFAVCPMFIRTGVVSEQPGDQSTWQSNLFDSDFATGYNY